MTGTDEQISSITNTLPRMCRYDVISSFPVTQGTIVGHQLCVYNSSSVVCYRFLAVACRLRIFSEDRYRLAAVRTDIYPHAALLTGHGRWRGGLHSAAPLLTLPQRHEVVGVPLTAAVSEALAAADRGVIEVPRHSARAATGVHRHRTHVWGGESRVRSPQVVIGEVDISLRH